MTPLIFLFLVFIVSLGIYIHRSYEMKPHNSARLINLTQFYINILIPIILGTLSFLITEELLRYPEVPFLFFSDKVLFYLLALFAAVCFIGCGMHITGKILSHCIDKRSKAYRVNRFYHIHLGHILPYTGFLLFIITLSILAMKHPIPQTNPDLYIIGGFVFAFFSIIVLSALREIMKIFRPIMLTLTFLYLMLVKDYPQRIIDSPASLFITSAMAVFLVYHIGELLVITLRRNKKLNAS